MNTAVIRDTRRLAVACLYCLLRKAVVSFPGSTRAAPSLYVWVNLGSTGALPERDGDRVYFPMTVPWYIWQMVVIPILTVTNPGTDPTDIGSGAVPNPLTGACYDLGVEIQTTLRASLRIEGNAYQVNLRDYDSLLDRLVQMIGMMMEDQNYLPSGTITSA